MSGVITAVALTVAAVGANTYMQNKQVKAQKQATQAQTEASNRALALQREQWSAEQQQQNKANKVSVNNYSDGVDNGNSAQLTSAQGVLANSLGNKNTLLGSTGTSENSPVDDIQLW